MFRKAYCVEFYSFVRPSSSTRTIPIEFYIWIDRDTYVTMKLKGEL